MKFQLTFSMNNAAFDPAYHQEAYNVLQKVIEQVGECRPKGVIRDSNGNTIGQWAIVKE